MLPNLNKQFACAVCIILSGLLSLLYASPEYPFESDFRVSAVSYDWAGNKALAMSAVNQDLRSFDSLELRLYFNATDEELHYTVNSTDTFVQLAARIDIAILYSADGFQQEYSENVAFRESVMARKPVRMSSSLFDASSGRYAWYYPVKLHGVTMRSGTRIRVDIVWDSRSPYPPYLDLLNSPPDFIPGNESWSWGTRRRNSGDPVDFGGIPDSTKEYIDEAFFDLQSNPYMAIFRNDQLLWGLPPDWKDHYGEDFDTVPQLPQEPLPYASVAIPFSEYAGQPERDSANLKISRVRVNQAGYRPGDENFFYYVGASPAAFSVLDLSNSSTAASGTLFSTGEQTSGQIRMNCRHDAQNYSGGALLYQLQSGEISGTVYMGTIPDLPEGSYKIAVGADTSAKFVIRRDVYNMVKDAMLKFYGANRCGDNSSWFHPACHISDPVPGGWHDAGDHIKLPHSIGYTMAVLGLCAAAFDSLDTDRYAKDQSKTLTTDGIPDIVAELKIGTDYLISSHNLSGGDVSEMKTETGDYGSDHMWWGRPEYQETMPSSRGGPPRLSSSGLGGNTAGTLCAGLAFMSKLYENYDRAYSETCLQIAEQLYRWGKENPSAVQNAAYSGETTANDNLALATLALWWATQDTSYRNDLLYDTTIGDMGSASMFPKGGFKGGWFVNGNPGPHKGTANTGWGSVHVYALWGLYSLILKDETTAENYGISSSERLNLIEDVIYNLIVNIGEIGDGDESITLPQSSFGWTSNTLRNDRLWGWMHVSQEWNANVLQCGNITDLFCYYDIARRIQGTELPNTPSTTDWKADEVKSVILKQLGFMLGMNPWDISMVMGLGNKNFNHAHHRASNPELNSTNFDYRYRHLTGSLTGGFVPSTPLYIDDAADYYHSEVSLNGVNSILLPVCGMGTEDISVRAQRKPLKHKSSVNNLEIKTLMTGKGLRITASKPVKSIVIYNVSGQVIANRRYDSKNACTISMDSRKKSLPVNGLYFMRIKFSDGSSFTEKINITRGFR